MPHAGAADTTLATNTTAKLLADIDLLRRRLGVDRWMVLGGSWGSTLALAYAEGDPERVTEMILFGITTGRRAEFDWLFRGGLSIFFPDEWERLRRSVPAVDRGRDLVDVYYRLLHDADDEIRRRAAEAWCLWESATPSWPPTGGLAARFRDPAYAMAFARIVTHYVKHYAWIEDGRLLRDAARLRGIPGVLVHGRFDFQAPLANAWELKQAWPEAKLVIVDNAGHAPNHAGMTHALVEATSGFVPRGGG
jgi:proline iminopeptidase